MANRVFSRMASHRLSMLALAYLVVTTVVLWNLTSTTSASRDPAPYPVASAMTQVLLTIDDLGPGASIVCTTASDLVGADMLSVTTPDEQAELFHTLRCAY